MKPIYIENYITKDYWKPLADLQWLSMTPARHEYFMAHEELKYKYPSKMGDRIYTSSPYSPEVLEILAKLNDDYKSEYNVCFLNRYDNLKHNLNWHSDSEPEMDTTHPICSISFGAEREIWWKKKGDYGDVPNENRQLLGNGSIFIMPAYFQESYLHRIPRADRTVGCRISLTFRKYVK